MKKSHSNRTRTDTWKSYWGAGKLGVFVFLYSSSRGGLCHLKCEEMWRSYDNCLHSNKFRSRLFGICACVCLCVCAGWRMNWVVNSSFTMCLSFNRVGKSKRVKLSKYWAKDRDREVVIDSAIGSRQPYVLIIKIDIAKMNWHKQVTDNRRT